MWSHTFFYNFQANNNDHDDNDDDDDDEEKGNILFVKVYNSDNRKEQ